ncbi:MAG: hypothetical protein P1P71_02110 [Anaerosomatales bacterium]|nr:hypothetical protein [Anaerosomatales bacterium]
MDPDDRLPPENAPGGETTGTPGWWRPKYLWYALAIIVVVALALPAVSTLQPGYYQRYPDLREPMDEWRTSTHARMTCASCHIEPGVGGFVRFAVSSIPAFYSQIVRGPSDSNLLGAPSTAACMRCHTTYRSVSPDGDLLIPHAAHVEVLGVDCMVCHEQLVHHESPLGINRPSMTGCFDNCHDGVSASQECAECHLRKNVPDSHQQDDWLEVHQAESEKVDCGECHGWTPDYCDQCHKERPRTHEGNWKTLHAPRAAENSQGCFFCHDEAYCNECHYGITRPE